MQANSESELIEVYRACLQHTLRIILSFIGFFAILCLLFGFYIYKSYDVVPSTITATQGMRSERKASAQRQSIKIQPGDSQNGRSKKSHR